MVTWIIFKHHFLEVDLTQNQETMALQTLTTIDLIYFIMVEEWPYKLEWVNWFAQFNVENVMQM